MPALTRLFEKYPYVILVVFEGTLGLDEFPELLPYRDRIETRKLVKHADLLHEIGRFDINIAPLELNPYCESKSELKYFEAALLKIPTIASPSAPYQQAITSEFNGFLAPDSEAWFKYLELLVTNKTMRNMVGANAYNQILFQYGPENRLLSFLKLLIDLDIFDRLNIRNANFWKRSFLFKEMIGPTVPSKNMLINFCEYETIFEQKGLYYSQVGVVVPLFNYENYVIEALESIRNQTIDNLDLVIVDDCSTDSSLSVALEWLQKYSYRFSNCAILKHKINSKLSNTRNTGFNYLQTKWIMPVDPDNVIYPNCLQACLNEIEQNQAAVVYPILELFGDDPDLIESYYNVKAIGAFEWDPYKLAIGNYIDAMALINKSAWAKVGGYDAGMRHGWEDYDLWLKFIENGFWGGNVPETLGGYRVHGNSMLRKVTNVAVDERRGEILFRHPWVDKIN